MASPAKAAPKPRAARKPAAKASTGGVAGPDGAATEAAPKRRSTRKTAPTEPA
jgi:hypothetical protein